MCLPPAEWRVGAEGIILTAMAEIARPQSPEPEAFTAGELGVCRDPRVTGELLSTELFRDFSCLKAEQMGEILWSLTEAHLARLSWIIFICFLSACFLINSGGFWKRSSVFP